jgi:hypothetical protein
MSVVGKLGESDKTIIRVLHLNVPGAALLTSALLFRIAKSLVRDDSRNQHAADTHWTGRFGRVSTCFKTNSKRRTTEE